MVCEDFLKDLRDAVAIFGIAVLVVLAAKQTLKENNVSILLGYARITAALIIASSVKKIIMDGENTLEEVEDKYSDIDSEDGISSSDDGVRCGC